MGFFCLFDRVFIFPKCSLMGGAARLSLVVFCR